ncbi:lytic transglycosylase [Psychroserpens jangbogonensis]|uniref:lytic transglycosylase n=1 Tax=Psychroserpens jangbogonensis TaxID=1484460 RepID=UPI00053EEDCE|nr:LysM peptidoglycan-binding domain-containing protein [Psychroserpens jangbogonensis]
MLKNFKVLAMVFVVIASCFEATAQTDTFKDVLLDGKPAKLNLVTGEITFTNGEIAKSRSAKKIKDSVLDTRTEIKTNLIKDMSVVSDNAQNVATVDSVNLVVDKVEDSMQMTESKTPEQTNSSSEANDYKVSTDVMTSTSDFHMVKEGENLYLLAKRYNTSLGQLKSANDLETTLIKVGETLRVRNFESLEEPSNIVWVVSKGDTLYNIAKRNNTTVDDIKNENSLSNNLIKIGQELQLNQNSTLSKK